MADGISVDRFAPTHADHPDGILVIQTPGGDGIAVNCCCCATCVDEDVAGSYAVAMAGGVDIDIPGADRGQECLGGTTGWGNTPWDYVVNALFSPPCSGPMYSQIDPGYAFANGVQFRMVFYKAAPAGWDYVHLSGNCTYEIMITIHWCTATGWVSADIWYTKRLIDTSPAGVYLFNTAVTSPGGTSLAGFVRPDYITLS